MFQELKPYSQYGAAPSPWAPAFPAAWSVVYGGAVLAKVNAKNDGLRETTVLSLSYGRVIVKPSEKLHGLAPASFETYQILEPGDIVFRPTDLQNDQTSLRVGAVEDHGIITSAYIALRPRGIDSRFAFLYLKALDHMKVFYGMGSGLRQNIDFRDFKRLPVPVPPKEEQQAIVRYLAHAHQRINKAIATKGRLIGLLDEQKRAIINLTVTRGTDHNPQLVDSGIPWIGSVPAHWQLLSARYLFKPVTRPVSTPSLPQLSLTRSAGLIESGIEGSNTKVAEGGKNLQECKWGDFVLNKYRAHMGLFRWCRQPGLVTRNYTVLIPKERVDRDYFEYLFLDPAYADGLRINARGVGDGMSPLYTSTLMSMKMPVPDLGEQRKIVERINAETARIDREVGLARREIQLLEEYKARLTTDVVTGQVDVRGIAATLPPIDVAEVLAAPPSPSGDDEAEYVMDGDEDGA